MTETGLERARANRELQEALAKCGPGKSAVKGAIVYALDSIEALGTKGFEHPDILSMMGLQRGSV